MNGQILLITLMTLFPHMPRTERRCIERSAESIVQRINDAEQNQHVPAGIILVVAFYESHIGCTHRRVTNWGTLIVRRGRHYNGTSSNAAVSLETGFRVCRNWEGAINLFRCGYCSCDPSRLIGYTPRRAILRIAQLYNSAGLPLPDNFRRPRNDHWYIQPRRRVQ
jgi:hypothetical protein